MAHIHLSTVTPVYRGAETLRDLVRELERVRVEMNTDVSPIRLVQAIFVDDGSSDGSDEVLRSLAAEYDWVQVVTLSRNFGQHPATMAGILHAGGDWIATLDEDLQHHPRFLIELLKKAVEGDFDVVYAHPETSVHGWSYRDFSSRSYKWMMKILSGNAYISKFNSFRIMRASVAHAAAAVASHQTYFDIAVSWFTTRIESVTLPLKDLRYIQSGKSGYTFRSLLSHARRLLHSSEIKLLRFGSVVGFSAMLISLLVMLYTLYVKFFSPNYVDVPGWASIMVTMLFLGGLSLFLLGLILDYLTILRLHSLGKPTFFEIDRSSDTALKTWLLQSPSK